MPYSQREIARQVPVVSSRPVACFEFPPDDHLLVTTPSCLLAWDQAGLHKIFKSSKSSIAAAREAQDGSNMLAVADQHVVVLHDTRQGRHDSWGLYADEDEVRLLEYTPDAKTLFLSTTSASELQQYSMEQSRLMSPLRNHATPPIALALSSTGHLMLSASDNPPTVCLKSLMTSSEPIMIQPRASEAPVVVASFHPERTNMFLLGFRDGTLAAYDATAALSSAERSGRSSNQEHFCDGEIAHIDHVHRATTKIVTKDSIGTKATSITAAAFLPGLRTRAVCAGSDGRCRLVDFAEGGVVLRTWLVKAPVTSVSVLPIAPPQSRAAHSLHNAARLKGVKSHLPPSMNNIIAVGRSDGKVQIYDSAGLLLAQKVMSQHVQRIISVEWIKGSSPPPIETVVPDSASKDRLRNLQVIDVKLGKQGKSQRKPEDRTFRGVQDLIDVHHLGLPPALLKPLDEALSTTRFPRRQFTIHPDEVEQDSVRHTPQENAAAPRPIAARDAYVDLFSPIKAATSAVTEIAKDLITSPPRTRPRISSLTFVKAGELPGSSNKLLGKMNNDLAILDPIATSDTDLGVSKVPRPQVSMMACKHISADVSPFAGKRRKSRNSVLPNAQSRQDDSAQPNENAKILANIRKLSSTQNTGSVLASFASTTIVSKSQQDHGSSRATKRSHYLANHKLFSPAHQKSWDPGNVLEREAAWVTDSNQDRSSDELEDTEEANKGRSRVRPMHGDVDGSADIWITSADETAGQHSHAQPRQRRQMRKATANSLQCVGRSKNSSPPTSSVYSQPTHPDLAVSAGEDMLSARTHFSSSHGLSPSSKDICDLFPRTSSLFSGRKNTLRKTTLHSGLRPLKGLREIHPNMVSSKSPWARARASKTHESGFVKPDGPMVGLVRSPTTACFDSVSNGARIAGLESEVARLKGEVLSLKAVLRRHGLPLPAALL